MGADEREQTGLILAARICALVALGVPALWSRDPFMVLGLVGLGACWVFATLLSLTRLPITVITMVESISVAMLCGLSLSHGSTLLSALAIPPFVAGLRLGGRGVVTAIAMEAVGLALIDTVGDFGPSPEQVAAVFSWLITGMGFGLVASFFRNRVTDGDGTAPYREARSLISDLLDLSGKLSSGLDVMALGGQLLDEIAASVPTETITLHIQRYDDVIPLLSRNSSADVDSDPSDALAAPAFAGRGSTHVVGHDFGFPLATRGGPVAVVTGRLAPGLDPAVALGDHALERLGRALEPTVVRLDTAQLFAAFRDAATSDERARLAREMHDGVAQDIASMGYLVDALAASATPIQVEPMRQLREMITSVVGEVRKSVMTLRTQAGENESLGAGIATLARHLSDVSGIPIQVTIDERTSRLRPEVEAELLRIAQESMNNAVKHADADVIDVHCIVKAPSALLTVADDGRGLGQRRHDSHGLSIMRERAGLIGASLEVRNRVGGGTLVEVRLGTSIPPLAGGSEDALPEMSKESVS